LGLCLSHPNVLGSQFGDLTFSNYRGYAFHGLPHNKDEFGAYGYKLLFIAALQSDSARLTKLASRYKTESADPSVRYFAKFLLSSVE